MGIAQCLSVCNRSNLGGVLCLIQLPRLQELQHDGQQYIVCTVPEVQPNRRLSSLAIRSTQSEGIRH